MRLCAAALLVVAVAATAASAAPSAWETRAPMPLPRTEVSAAAVGNEIVVLGGFTIDRGASRRVDAYSPARDTWRRLPDLPIGVHHAMAVGAGGKPYVLGGYTVAGATLRAAFVLESGAWRALPRMPFPGPPPVRASQVGGSSSPGASARAEGLRETHSRSISARGAGRSSPGPTPREHLGVTSLAGTVYAVGGRTAGLDTNLLHFESFRPGDQRVAATAAGSRSAGRNGRGRDSRDA